MGKLRMKNLFWDMLCGDVKLSVVHTRLKFREQVQARNANLGGISIRWYIKPSDQIRAPKSGYNREGRGGQAPSNLGGHSGSTQMRKNHWGDYYPRPRTLGYTYEFAFLSPVVGVWLWSQCSAETFNKFGKARRKERKEGEREVRGKREGVKEGRGMEVLPCVLKAGY